MMTCIIRTNVLNVKTRFEIFSTSNIDLDIEYAMRS